MPTTKESTYMPYLITKLSNCFGGESNILNACNVHKNLFHRNMQHGMNNQAFLTWFQGGPGLHDHVTITTYSRVT